MTPKILIALALAASAFGASAQVTGNVAVTASVAAACQVTTTSAMMFGVYSPLSGAAVDATGSVSVACVKGSVPVLGINTGANASSAQRRMAVGGNFLNYDVYQPSSNAADATCAYTAAWGATGLTGTAAPSLAARKYNICGRIPASQDVPAGNYADTLVVTVTF